MAFIVRQEFLTEKGKQALRDAIKNVEARSAAELVIAARDRSSLYGATIACAAMAASLLVLVFLLFSPFDFALPWFVIDPIAGGLLAALLTWRWDGIARLLTPRRLRSRAVSREAEHLFLDKRIHQTSGRTGILLYLSLLERDACLVADVGIEEAVNEQAWAESVAKIREAIRRGGTAVEVAGSLEPSFALLEEALPRAEDDVNELVDEVSEE